MKLYDVPRDSYVMLSEDARVPVGCEPLTKGTVVYFGHIDGMYSYCMDKDKQRVLHVAVFTEVEIINP